MSSDSTQKPKPAIKMTDTSRLRSGAAPVPAPAPGLEGVSAAPRAGVEHTDTAHFTKLIKPSAAPAPAPASDAQPKAAGKTDTGHFMNLVKPSAAPAPAPAPQNASATIKTEVEHTDTARFTKLVKPAVVPPTPAPAPAADAQPKGAGQTDTGHFMNLVKPTVVSEGSSIVDPVAKRDTSTGRLRRLSVTGQGDSALTAVIATPAAPGKMQTDTVRLKVQRETKKEVPAAGASQTVRLRPPPGMDGQTSTARPPSSASPGSTIRLAAPVPAGEPAAAPVDAARQTVRVKPMTAPAPAAQVEPDAAATVSVPMPDSATGTSDQTVRVDGDGTSTQVAKRTLRIRRDEPAAPGTAEEGDVARAATPLTAVAPTRAAVSQTDMVFNLFCAVNVLVIGGAIGILTWQCVKHL